MLPIVAMKDGMPAFTVTIPFAIPIITPIAKVASKAHQTGSPAKKSKATL